MEIDLEAQLLLTSCNYFRLEYCMLYYKKIENSNNINQNIIPILIILS